MIHFLLTKGDLTWQYERAIKSAEVHGEQIALWYDEPFQGAWRASNAYMFPLKVPSWLKEKGYHPSYTYDYLSLKLLLENGGMALGLDTISVKPAMDLLGEYELCVSCDVPFEDYVLQTRPIKHPFSMHMIAQKDSDVVAELLEECEKRLRSGRVTWEDGTTKDLEWGDSGPGLLTEIVLSHPEKATWAPFPALCGWEGSYIWKYYCGLDEPSEDVRVIHLFSSAYPTLFEGGPRAVEDWVLELPDFAWVLPNKMPEILRKP